jgi:hypothetical protein
MAISLTQSLIDLKEILGDQNAAFDTQMLTDWLSVGQQATAAMTLAYQRRATFLSTDSPQVLVAGTREYTFAAAVGSGGWNLPTAICGLYVYLNGQNLPLWTANMVTTADPRTTATTSTTPQYWYKFGGAIGLLPTPTTAFIATSWRLDLLYADLPVDWTSGNSVLPGGLDELPVYYAATRLLLSRRQWQRASQTYTQFLLLLHQYRRTTISRDATTREEIQQPVRRQRADTPKPPTQRELRLQALQGGRR